MNPNAAPPTHLSMPVSIVVYAFLAVVALCWFVAVFQSRQRRQDATRQNIERYQQAPAPEFFAPAVRTVPDQQTEEVFNWAEQGPFSADPSIYERVTDQARMFPREDA